MNNTYFWDVETDSDKARQQQISDRTMREYIGSLEILFNNTENVLNKDNAWHFS